MKTIIITQARMSSTRLPGKVIKEIAGKTLLAYHLESLKKVEGVDEVYVATTNEEGIGPVLEISKGLGIKYFQGSVDDVLERFYRISEIEKPDTIIRVTSDCPLIDASLISSGLRTFNELNIDYLTNTLNPTYPDGMDFEIFKASALYKSWEQAKKKSEREHVTPYIWKNSSFHGGSLFSSYSFENKKNYSGVRLTVDVIDDYELVKKLIIECGEAKSWKTYVDFLENNSDLLDINKNNKRNEGYDKSLKND
ncbi:MAG: spore coat polysaccharide biosynthesis protein SpsF (cytidylyltransferase family) [Bacteriovoracaceae bacterium]